jgi:hypothetical protein
LAISALLVSPQETPRSRAGVGYGGDGSAAGVGVGVGVGVGYPPVPYPAVGSGEGADEENTVKGEERGQGDLEENMGLKAKALLGESR